jgi:hypothetical protein
VPGRPDVRDLSSVLIVVQQSAKSFEDPACALVSRPRFEGTEGIGGVEVETYCPFWGQPASRRHA